MPRASSSTIHSPEYRALLDLLRKERDSSGLSQAELAARLGRHQSYLSKIETAERRLDLEELRQLCEAMDTDMLKVVKKWLKEI